MQIPKELIDNSEENQLSNFLKQMLKENANTNFDIATAFFNVKAYIILKDELNGVKRFRLLLGKPPEIANERTLGDELIQRIKEEVEGFELTKESNDDVKNLINFLKKENVEVRIFEKFLHGKTYIFDNLVVIGSSNFTSAGLTRYGELNSVSPQSLAEYTRRNWFEKFWNESINFKEKLIELLENSRFGSKEYLPYEVYIKALYELQKEDLKAEEKDKEKVREQELVNLTEFQDDSINRIMSRLKKYNAVLVADSVGLGKTHIALKVIEKYHLERRRNRILVICPAQIRELVWRKQLKEKILPENIISQEELASKDFIKKVKKAVSKIDEIKLVVVDESHNLRNPLSNRWENFFTLIDEHISKPHILFLTATPINNTIWDLYWQIMLMIKMNEKAFMKENIPNLPDYFKNIENKGEPKLLADLLNEISIRRTRDYIIKNYPNAYITKDTPDGEIKEPIKFPERELENINYKLDKTYKGMYREISNAIAVREEEIGERKCLFCGVMNAIQKKDCDCGKPLELTMACYRLLEYKKESKLTPEEEKSKGRMIGIGGIFRTILLKRLESSVDSFRISVGKHIKFLNKLKEYLNNGKILTKKTFIKHILSADEEIEEYADELEDFKIQDYKKDELIKDIDKDIELLKKILLKVKTIKPEEDAKLNRLKEKLLELSKKGQIILFTYYTDTLEYIFREISNSKEFKGIRIEAISSSGKETGKPPKKREKIIENFFDKNIDILMSTDVLSEGQNLQTAQYLINYDLHWNPVKMIQRAGRIDRIGSTFEKIFVYNFFPEDELEYLLKLVGTLQKKINDIDASVGLDQTILGEKIHPKVFGIIIRIKEKDKTVMQELEIDIYGGGERFYQPLKDFLKKFGEEELEKIPYGIHSGLKKNKIKGIFFYYKYDKDFHLWYLYDVIKEKIIDRKSEIIEFIECNAEEGRVIPDFFEKVYEINNKIVQEIERLYKELEDKQEEPPTFEYSKERNKKFINKMIREIENHIQNHLEEFPEDKQIVQIWDVVRSKLLSIPITMKKLRELRRYWRTYNKDKDWKKLIKELNNFLFDKRSSPKEKLPPFDKEKLKLIVIDFIS